MVKRYLKLKKKHESYERELQKEQANLQELQAKREERLAQLVADDGNINNDRELLSFTRPLPKLKEKIENLSFEVSAISKALGQEAENVLKSLIEEIEKRKSDSEAEYRALNSENILMIQAAREFTKNKVVPAHRAFNAWQDLSINFSTKSRWTADELMRCIDDPSLLIPFPEVADCLGLKDEVSKLAEKKQEQASKEVDKAKRAEEMERAERKPYELEALRIQQGRIPVPEHIRPFADSSAPLSVLVKLLRTISPKKESENGTEKTLRPSPSFEEKIAGYAEQVIADKVGGGTS